MSDVRSTMQSLQAESLLEGSALLTQIATLRDALTYPTDDTVVSFDDHFLWLQGRIDGVPRIKLLDSIPVGAGGRYENELLTALENIFDAIEKWTVKVVRFQADVARAQSDVEELQISFEAWYVMAALDFMKENTLHIPVAIVKNLAKSEYSRLMSRSNISLDSLKEALKVELERLKSKRKMAQQKFTMGREQVTAMWGNAPGQHQGFGIEAPKFELLAEATYDEEDEDDSPVSYRSITGALVQPSAVAVPQDPALRPNDIYDDAESLPKALLPEEDLSPVEPKVYVESAEHAAELAESGPVATNTYCSECWQDQYLTPGGITCVNGHGGAHSLSLSQVRDREAILIAGCASSSITLDAEQHITQSVSYELTQDALSTMEDLDQVHATRADVEVPILSADSEVYPIELLHQSEPCDLSRCPDCGRTEMKHVEGHQQLCDTCGTTEECLDVVTETSKDAVEETPTVAKVATGFFKTGDAMPVTVIKSPSRFDYDDEDDAVEVPVTPPQALELPQEEPAPVRAASTASNDLEIPVEAIKAEEAVVAVDPPVTPSPIIRRAVTPTVVPPKRVIPTFNDFDDPEEEDIPSITVSKSAALSTFQDLADDGVASAVKEEPVVIAPKAEPKPPDTPPAAKAPPTPAPTTTKTRQVAAFTFDDDEIF